MKTLIDTPTIECPNHNGGFDCSPFCRLCEGEQETDLDTLLNYATSISWDGCHKIYLNMDYIQHEKMIELGYDKTVIATNPWMAREVVDKWYDDSCSLRFIDAVFTDEDTDKFVTIVPQFFGEEEND